MGVPEGGQQKPLTGSGVLIGAPIVSCLARRGDCLRGVLSRMRWIKIQNGIGIGHGFGMFAPFGDAAFLGGVYPQVPLHLRRGGHLGLFKVWPLWGRLACHYLSGPLGVPLSLGAAWRAIISIQGLAPLGPLGVPLSRGRLACRCLRGRLAHSCQAPCQTWPKNCLIPMEKASQI
jgi:hypothetical protein